jgi:hypothetical protein
MHPYPARLLATTEETGEAVPRLRKFIVSVFSEALSIHNVQNALRCRVIIIGVFSPIEQYVVYFGKFLITLLTPNCEDILLW